MAKKKIIVKKTSSKNDDPKLFAFLATFLSIIGFIIVLLTRRDDEYVMFYARQSLVLFIFAIIAGIVQIAIGWVPVLGWTITIVLQLIIVILWIISWVYALSDKKKMIPFIGEYADKINL